MWKNNDIIIKIDGEFDDKNSLFSYAFKRLWNIIFSSDTPWKLKPLGDTKLISLYNSVPYINSKLNTNYNIWNISVFIKEYKNNGWELERIKWWDLVSKSPVYLLDDIERLITFIKSKK